MWCAQVLRKTILAIPFIIVGSLATTIKQDVVPAQPGSAAGARGSFHHMTPDGKVTGEYEVELPDGRTQHVIYTADHDQGYIANISYRGEAKYPSDVQQYTTPRYTGIQRHPSWVLGSSSYNFGGKIKEDTLSKPTPQKLTPTPVEIPSLKRPSGIVISEPQYGYKAWYPQPFTKIGVSFDSKYNSKSPSSSSRVGNNYKINKTRKYFLQTKQSARDHVLKGSKRFPSGRTTLPTTISTTISDITLDPFYPHYGKSAKLLKKTSRYPTKGPLLPYPQELPKVDKGTEYKKNNIIPDRRISNTDKESEPLYIPKYFDFAVKRPYLGQG